MTTMQDMIDAFSVDEEILQAIKRHNEAHNSCVLCVKKIIWKDEKHYVARGDQIKGPFCYCCSLSEECKAKKVRTERSSNEQ
jgi:hypothetical protein